MSTTFRLETQAGRSRRGVLSDLRDGAVYVLAADGGDEPQVALRLDFARNAYFFLGLREAGMLGAVLRSHAALAQRPAVAARRGAVRDAVEGPVRG